MILLDGYVVCFWSLLSSICRILMQKCVFSLTSMPQPLVPLTLGCFSVDTFEKAGSHHVVASYYFSQMSYFYAVDY